VILLVGKEENGELEVIERVYFHIFGEKKKY